MRLFGSENIANMVDRLGLDEDTPIDAKILSNSIESAQKRLEAQNFNRRKNVLTYDDVMNQQRSVIYEQRREVLDGMDLHDKIADMIQTVVSDAVRSQTVAEQPSAWNFENLRAYFAGTLCTKEDFRYSEQELSSLTREQLIEESCNSVQHHCMRKKRKCSVHRRCVKLSG